MTCWHLGCSNHWVVSLCEAIFASTWSLDFNLVYVKKLIKYSHVRGSYQSWERCYASLVETIVWCYAQTDVPKKAQVYWREWMSPLWSYWFIKFLYICPNSSRVTCIEFLRRINKVCASLSVLLGVSLLKLWDFYQNLEKLFRLGCFSVSEPGNYTCSSEEGLA